MIFKNAASTLLQLELPGNPGNDQVLGGGSPMIAVILMVLMVGGLASVYFLVKRYGFVKKPGQGKLKILETRALGGRQFLVVGQYGQDSFLLGVCPGRIDYLARLEDEDSVTFNEMLGGGPPAQANRSSQ